MKTNLIKKPVLLILVLLLVCAIAPVVYAYEGQAVDVRAHLEGKPMEKLEKTFRLATAQEIAGSGICFPGIPNPPGVTRADRVPKFTCVVWIVTITVNNIYDYTMWGTWVHDNFNAEVDIDLLDVSQGTVDFEGDHKLSCWDIGTLASGQSATLNLIVWTGLTGNNSYPFSSSGAQPECEPPHQQFTDCGWHWLNCSGATLKWCEKVGNRFVQHSWNTGPKLQVWVY
jgi:hypothetical protein